MVAGVSGAARERVDVGIVVIGRNEGARLARCLKSAAGSAPLLYVDSGSTDGSVELAHRLGVTVHELSPDRPFSAARARNEGFAALLAREPQLRFVQFLDGDCELDPAWLAQGRAALAARPRAAAVCGRLRERAPAATLWNRLCDIEWHGPTGAIDACGGVFLVRTDAFAGAGGFDPAIVAAEEDDLCVRLREAGREIVRIEAEMARHDAAMERFGQWWRRSVRTGQAYAQVAARHRGSPLRPFVREARSAWLLGLGAPLAILAAGAATRGAGLLLALLYVPLVARVAVRLAARGTPRRDAWLYAAHCYAAKVPQAVGLLRHLADRALRRPSRLIEHKGGVPAQAGAAGEWRVGFVGAGYIAEWHRRALRLVPGARLVAVADRVAGRAEAVAAAAGARAYASLAEMLRDEELHAVHVLLPPAQHCEAAREILAAGVAALVEKPMGTSAAECAELERAGAVHGLRLGVSHNFLFAPAFERLARDVRSGRLGPLEQVEITWNRELAQLASGPFDAWMLAAPGNIALEIGSHLLASALELCGEPDRISATADAEATLPGGRRFLRRWAVDARAGGAAIRLRASFLPGFSEWRVHARGVLGAATADLEHGTYRVRTGSRWPTDLEALRGALAAVRDELGQALRLAFDAAAAKAGFARAANPFEASIAGALRAFYAGLGRPGPLDARISAARGRRVVELALAVAEEAGAATAVAPREPVRPAAAARPAPDVLVLGGGGFIGRALVERLLAEGASVRVLGRSAAGAAFGGDAARLERVAGDLHDAAMLDRALAGVRVVYDLARSQGPTWEDFVRQDVAGARRVAEAALAHGVERLIYASTIDCYYAGRAGEVITESTPLDPSIGERNFYARAKAAAEAELWRLHRERGLPVVVARPGIVIGAGASPMHGGVGEWSGLGVVATYGGGAHPLPLVLVGDCADALARMRTAPGLAGRSFNLVGPPLLSAQAYLDALERAGGLALARSAPPIGAFYLADVAKWLVKTAVRHPGRSRQPSFRDFASRTQRARFDCTAARDALGWEPCADRDRLIELGLRVPLDALLESGRGLTPS
jgi:nucleoside-diphosphate-sugar epimerase/predicted dehydrogenase/GT2 family glycosyltransferase